MNKNEFIADLSSKSGLPRKTANEITNFMMQIITERLTIGEPVAFMGFGTFKPIVQESRIVRNPRTLEKVEFKRRKTARFKPGKFLLERLNKNGHI